MDFLFQFISTNIFGQVGYRFQTKLPQAIWMIQVICKKTCHSETKVQLIWLIPIICKTYKFTEGPFLQKAILSWPEQFLSEFACFFFVKQNLIEYVPCIIDKPNIKGVNVKRLGGYPVISITSEECKTSHFRYCPGTRSKICMPFKLSPSLTTN